MAVDWGSYVYAGGNGMRVGIELVSWSSPAYTDTTATITFNVWTQNQYNYSDGQTVTYTGGSQSYTNSGGSGSSSKRVSNATSTYTYGANPGTKTITATLSGLYNGGSPTVSASYATPTRPSAPAPPPPPPTLYAPTIGTTSATSGIRSASISFSATDGGSAIDYYHIYKNGAYLAQVTSSPYSATLGNGETASFKVYAHNAIGWSAESNSVSVTTPSLPSTPGSLTANTDTFGTVGLSWAASTGSGYTVTYTIARNGTPLGTTTGTTYNDTTVAPYTTYTYTVTPSTDVGSNTAASISATSMGGICKIWNGTTWVTALPKVWNGTSWVTAQARIWDGSQWKYGI